MATDLVTIATTAALTQFVGPAFKHLGEQALERAKQVASKAASYLNAVEREPKPIEPKLLIPMVQAASLETDNTLTEKWAALLANAADPAPRETVQPGFAEVLRQLTPIDARVFDVLADIKTEPQTHLPNFVPVCVLQEAFKPASKQDVDLSISNLTRLGLTVTAGQQPIIESTPLVTSPPGLSTVGPGIDHVRLVPFGRAFLAAITPPAL